MSSPFSSGSALSSLGSSSSPSSPPYSASRYYEANQPLWQEKLPGGHHWSGRIRRGTVVQFSAQAVNANLSALFFNAEEKLERYNMPDTLKAQHTAFLSTGHVCYSDMGRVMCSIIRDDTGWIDTICGVTDASQIQAQYGSKTFSDARNDMYRNGRDGLLVEMEKWGLGHQDLVANINLFSKVSAEDHADHPGALVWAEQHSKAGDVIELRFEMETLLVLSSAPHVLNPANTYQPADIVMTAYKARPLAPDDLCLNFCPQNQRGFANNARYFGEASFDQNGGQSSH